MTKPSAGEPSCSHSEAPSKDISDLLQATSFQPSVRQVYNVIIALKGDSGIGSDLVSAWLLKDGEWTIAEIIREIIIELITLHDVPIVWRGGRLVVIYKGKGTNSDPDKYRGILVSDHMSKIVTALILRHIDDLYGSLVGNCQFGAVNKRGPPSRHSHYARSLTLAHKIS